MSRSRDPIKGYKVERSSLESSNDGFVPARDWDALRKQYPHRRSRKRGFRALAEAMESENPECSAAAGSWVISPMDRLPGLDVGGLLEEDWLVTRAQADLDRCFASESFLDELDWAVQTHGLSFGDGGEDVNMDAELELLEAVQDLTRFVARTTPRRTAADHPAQESIPD